MVTLYMIVKNTTYFNIVKKKTFYFNLLPMIQTSLFLFHLLICPSKYSSNLQVLLTLFITRRRRPTRDLRFPASTLSQYSGYQPTSFLLVIRQAPYIQQIFWTEKTGVSFIFDTVIFILNWGFLIGLISSGNNPIPASINRYIISPCPYPYERLLLTIARYS